MTAAIFAKVMFYGLATLGGLVVLAVLGGVKLASDIPGFSMATVAFKMDEKCQQARVAKSDQYEICQQALDKFLIENNLLVLKKCVPNLEDDSAANCPVYAWYRYAYLVTRAPVALEHVKKAKKSTKKV